MSDQDDFKSWRRMQAQADKLSDKEAGGKLLKAKAFAILYTLSGAVALLLTLDRPDLRGMGMAGLVVFAVCSMLVSINLVTGIVMLPDVLRRLLK